MTPDDSEPIVPSPLELKGGPAELERYKGKVVAIIDGEVRAFADTWGECIRAVRQLGLDVATTTFWAVPRGLFVG